MRAGARRFRVAGGVVMMALAAALTFNLTDGLLRRTPAYTAAIQDTVEGNETAELALQQLAPLVPAAGTAAAISPAPGASGPVRDLLSAAQTLANCGPAPDLVGIDTWINTPDEAPVSVSGLTGKVVLVDFWTFACINCQHVLPSVTPWYGTYHAAGLEVIGVHTRSSPSNTTPTTSGKPSPRNPFTTPSGWTTRRRPGGITAIATGPPRT